MTRLAHPLLDAISRVGITETLKPTKWRDPGAAIIPHKDSDALTRRLQHADKTHIKSGRVSPLTRIPILRFLRQHLHSSPERYGAEASLLVGSTFEANVAIWTSLPRPGDVVYDSLVHASTHKGIKQSLIMDKFEFLHNDVEDFHRALLEAIESNKLELVEVARELSNEQGNIQFVVDEAHSVGVIGPKGAGLVCELGLQKDVAVVVHSFGKALGATGGESSFIAIHGRRPDPHAPPWEGLKGYGMP
ncbi:hypothetical protein HIM_09176 [Hirsutella minnesotensis 3608]|uniref:Aminotransferase class I/classII large domain-containing protein n=1 Tax=Hirsutella minnesotensis 3608 TaxID=1043627 RepID=A0A0F7ZXW9_9HYPO|nr:hypothetical protein HIM_09176 [Hirsutella minnesotensis 3608]